MDQEYRDKLAKLRCEIFSIIAPLITGDAHLTNLPYHSNLGDSLIWQGTEDFLTETGHKILSRSSFLSCRFPKVKPDDVIILNGGGNFGDIWRMIMDFIIRVTETYPHNRIILLSQSAWYDNPNQIEADAKILARHRDLHLVARDEVTYNLFQTHFSDNPSYLAPDMAFAIKPDRLMDWQMLPPSKGTLYLRRIDKEWDPKTEITIPDALVTDWPTISSPGIIEKCYFAALNRTMYKIGHSATKDLIYWPIVEMSSRPMILNRFLKRGSEFILPYSRIVTTRLHVLILATLLGRQVEYIDNITGKLSAFVNTWLTDFPNIKPYEAQTLVGSSNV